MAAKKPTGTGVRGVLSDLGIGLPKVAGFVGNASFKLIANNHEAQEHVARAMADDEGVKWEEMKTSEKRDWRARARAAMLGFASYLSGK